MIRAIVGANWGDEGKGKITDMCADQSDIVVRFQGGANAGHTIIMSMVVSHFISYLAVFSMSILQMLLQMVLHLMLIH